MAEGGIGKTILQAGGVAVAGISLVGIAISGAFTFFGTDRNAQAELETAQIEARLEAERIESEERRALCAELFDYLEDDTPNESLPPEVRDAVADMIVQNLPSCTISYDESFAESLPGLAEPEPEPEPEAEAGAAQ